MAFVCKYAKQREYTGHNNVENQHYGVSPGAGVARKTINELGNAQTKEKINPLWVRAIKVLINESAAIQKSQFAPDLARQARAGLPAAAIACSRLQAGGKLAKRRGAGNRGWGSRFVHVQFRIFGGGQPSVGVASQDLGIPRQPAFTYPDLDLVERDRAVLLAVRADDCVRSFHRMIFSVVAKWVKI